MIVLLSSIMLTSCSNDDSNYNPGFVVMESVNGQSDRDYYNNFDKQDEIPSRIDIYKEPSRAEDQRVVKISADDNGNKKGTIVVNEGSGVGYIYDSKKNKKEVVVVGDDNGKLWAVDKEGNSYPVAISE